MRFIAIALVALSVFVSPVSAQSLDPSFGSGGVVLMNIGKSTHALGSAVAVQEDGKIVVAGESFNGRRADVEVSRYRRDGSVDMSFGDAGVASTPFSGGIVSDHARAVAVQSDGRIVVAGYSAYATRSAAYVIRYRSNGRLDATFGEDGVLHVVGLFKAMAVALDAQGRIVVAGTSRSGDHIAVARYLPDGAPDTTFGGGWVITPVTDDDDIAYAVAIDHAGRIVVSGSSCCFLSNAMIVARYNPDGTPDNTFDGDGVTTTPIGSGWDAGSAIAVQGDGKIVTCGRFSSGKSLELAIVRYNSDGSLDESFNGDGTVTNGTSRAGEDECRDLAIQSDGKIIAAGASYTEKDMRYLVLRYESTGKLDAAFGDGGAVVGKLDSRNVTLEGIALQLDGRVVVAGSAFDDEVTGRFVARLGAAGNLDAKFGEDGTIFARGGKSSDTARALLLQPDGRLLVAGNAREDSELFGAIGRYEHDGTPDRTFGNAGIVALDDGAITALGLQTDGNVLALKTVLGNAAIARYDDTGNIDVGFGTRGRTFLPTDGGTEWLDLTVDGDSAIAAGRRQLSDRAELRVARLDENGALDVDFGRRGVATFPLGPVLPQRVRIITQSPGRLVAAADTTQGIHLSRLLEGGRQDPDFSYPSAALVADDDAVVDSLAIQPDGKLVVGGMNPSGVFVMRVQADGSIDERFGSGGVVSVPGFVGELAASRVAVRGDAKILVGTDGYNGIDTDFLVTLLHPDGRRDTDFGVEGVLSADLGGDALEGVALQRDGKFVVVGSNVSDSGADIAILRYGGDPCGDASEDASISATDALRILVASLGIGDCAACRCDADASGDTTATDALLVLRAALDLTSALHCVPCP